MKILGHKKPSYYPFPAKPEITIGSFNTFFSHADCTLGWPIIWIGNYNDTVAMIGVREGRVFLSLDNGTTWDFILDDSAGTNNYNGCYCCVVNNPSDADKIVLISTTDGKVYRSTNLASRDLADWELVLTMSSGYAHINFSGQVYGNKVILSSYGTKNALNPPRHVYISDDYGGTWKEIEMVAPASMVDSSDFHIHAAVIDVYTSRLMVLTGDSLNANLWVSEDWGSSFTKVYPDGEVVMHPTTIHCLPDRILFGSDTTPTGFAVWYRPTHENKPIIRKEDITDLYTSERMSKYAREGVIIKNCMPEELFVTQYPYNMVIPIHQDGNMTSRIIASPDGEDWWEIFHPGMVDMTFSDPVLTLDRVCGPAPNDPNKYIYGRIYHSSVGAKVMRMKMPAWVKLD